ncbi:hypothetical protein FWK35_00038957 [Aphis craccivora]|uniref:Uncharacterized protein n=1 Tax=Aphis craccivora TaxID=307492 RepID=A0A6G0YGV8_APHCR|nr:hypothetical protein FWK35_00038957 [Aphis craccivora]
MQNDESSQTTHRKSTEAVRRYFGRYFLIVDFLLTVVVYTILLAIGYAMVAPLVIASFTVIRCTVADLAYLIGSIYSHLCKGLCFLMFHCHVTFINVFVAVTMIWLVLAMLISFSDRDRLVLLLTIHDDELIVQ